MKLDLISKDKLTPNITMKELIIDQKDSDYGTTALDSVFINDFNPKEKTVSITIKRQNNEFDKLVENAAKRQSFLGRVNDNLLQLFDEFQIDVKWLSGFDTNFNYILNKE